jgi:multiple sugar transport system substrate-binding protein
MDPTRQSTRGRTRRAALATAAGLPAALSSAACLPGRGEGGPPASKEPVTIRWSTWGNSANPFVQAAEQGLALFRQQQPHITVVPEPQEAGWQEKNVSQWVAGDGPDVSGATNHFLPTWSRKGLLLILDRRIKQDFTARQIQDYVESHWRFFTTKERGQHALPMFLDTAALVFNKDLFRRAGVALPDDTWDWNRQLEAMRRLTDPAQEQFGADINTAIPRLQERIIQNGGWVVDPDDDTRCLLDQPPALEALRWVQERIWRDNVAPQPQQKAGKNLPMLGKAGMWELGSWFLTRHVRDTVRGQYDWDVAPYPRQRQRGTVATTDGWGIWTGTRAPDACWLLLRFLQTDEWYDIVMRIVGNQPPRKSLSDRWIRTVKQAIPELGDKNLGAFTDAKARGYAFPNAVFRFDDDVRPLLQEAINKTVVTNEAPLVDTMRAAVAAANARLKQLAGQ